MNMLVCPENDWHGPHNGRALFCWVCGQDLYCESCERLASASHAFFRDERCPVVRVKLPAYSAASPA